MTLAALRAFVRDFTALADRRPDEAVALAEGGALLRTLLEADAWLPESCGRPSAERYQQYLLHCDPLERFSVVSFVWNGGQQTPVHNHTVWGLVGVLQGAEVSTAYTLSNDGSLIRGQSRRLVEGDVEAISPAAGDIHHVMNAFTDDVSISIHVYGANIGRVKRSVFRDGERIDFISGYANTDVPNIW